MNIEYHEKHLSNLGIELEKSRVRRLNTLTEIQRVSSVAELTKCNKSIGALGPLNRAEEADARLIRSLEQQIADGKRMLDLARAQSAGHAAAVARSQPSPEKNRWYIVAGPDGKDVKHRHYNSGALQKELLPGYCVTAELWNCDDAGKYGVAVPLDHREAVLKYCMEQSA